MYVKVIKILYNEDKGVITRLAASNEDGLATHFGFNEADFRKAEEVGDGIFVLTNTGTQSKLSNLEKLFKLYGENPSDLVFYMRDDSNTESDEDEAKRYELRRRYWSYALPYIKEANAENGCFKNVGVTKGNWIAGWFGISRFGITCAANYDCARVELDLAKSDKESNKKTFDLLYSHKDGIEKALGSELNWLRGDDIKSSFITIRLKDVSIDNESDWPRMASFQAQWSKKFYDVLVPYLR